jgi:hypothetical protein
MSGGGVKFGFLSLGHVPKPLDLDTWADGQEQARVNIVRS